MGWDSAYRSYPYHLFSARPEGLGGSERANKAKMVKPRGGQGGASDDWDGSAAFWTHPRIHPKLGRLTRKYRGLGGNPCAVKSFKVKVDAD